MLSLDSLWILGNCLSAVFGNFMKICLFHSLLHVFCMFSFLFLSFLSSGTEWSLISHPSALGNVLETTDDSSLRCLLLFLDPSVQMWNPLSPCSLSFLSFFPAQVFAFYSKVNFLIFYPFTGFHFSFARKCHALISKAVFLECSFRSILFLLYLCFLLR